MIRATRTQWIKFADVLALYLIFLVWLRSWLGLVVVPFIFDAYITKKIPWTWWRESNNRHVVTVMGWVDAIVFAPVSYTHLDVYKRQDQEKFGDLKKGDRADAMYATEWEKTPDGRLILDANTGLPTQSAFKTPPFPDTKLVSNLSVVFADAPCIRG